MQILRRRRREREKGFPHSTFPRCAKLRTEKNLVRDFKARLTEKTHFRKGDSLLLSLRTGFSRLDTRGFLLRPLSSSPSSFLKRAEKEDSEEGKKKGETQLMGCLVAQYGEEKGRKAVSVLYEEEDGSSPPPPSSLCVVC